jgi:hypothetical protein
MSLRRSVEKTSAFHPSPLLLTRATAFFRLSLLYAFVLMNNRRFILRDFTFSEDAVERQREELRATEISERELWVGLFPVISVVWFLRCFIYT